MFQGRRRTEAFIWLNAQPPRKERAQPVSKTPDAKWNGLTPATRAEGCE
jgi:hypothetical protein